MYVVIRDGRVARWTNVWGAYSAEITLMPDHEQGEFMCVVVGDQDEDMIQKLLREVGSPVSGGGEITQ